MDRLIDVIPSDRITLQLLADTWDDERGLRWIQGADDRRRWTELARKYDQEFLAKQEEEKKNKKQ